MSNGQCRVDPSTSLNRAESYPDQRLVAVFLTYHGGATLDLRLGGSGLDSSGDIGGCGDVSIAD